MIEFVAFPKIPRFNREIIITEKIDGTNAQVFISEDGEVRAGSRNRWLTPETDNYGFSRWVFENEEELKQLGPGHHYGEWWGQGIQRRYGLNEKRFSLFNVNRWSEERPRCCDIVPTLYVGPFTQSVVEFWSTALRSEGSFAAPGFMQPEGIIIYHTSARQYFKITLEGDEGHKN